MVANRLLQFGGTEITLEEVEAVGTSINKYQQTE
jgi:hypothetical protein